MARPTRVEFFKCPNCDALYQVVRAEAGPETTSEGERACRVCGAPLAVRDGAFVLKYFLLRWPAVNRFGKSVGPFVLLGVWSHGIVAHCITISGGTNYGTNSSRQRHND